MTSESTSLRIGPRPGDLGTVLAMHGRIYAQEYGYDEGFEAHVAHGLAEFATALGEARRSGAQPGWLWLAEQAGEPVGTIALTDEGDGLGQLRWFLVEPRARGGLGRMLLTTLLDHARTQGFQRVSLWTVDPLDAAAKLYLEAGFHRTERHRAKQWGHQIDELRYDLAL